MRNYGKLRAFASALALTSSMRFIPLIQHINSNVIMYRIGECLSCEHDTVNVCVQLLNGK